MPHSLAAWLLLLLAATGIPERAGDLSDVRVTDAREPVNGVRMIQVTGRAERGVETVWVMISERNYARLIGCRRGEGGAGAAIQYSDRTLLVTVVVCE